MRATLHSNTANAHHSSCGHLQLCICNSCAKQSTGLMQAKSACVRPPYSRAHTAIAIREQPNSQAYLCGCSCCRPRPCHRWRRAGAAAACAGRLPRHLQLRACPRRCLLLLLCCVAASFLWVACHLLEACSAAEHHAYNSISIVPRLISKRLAFFLCWTFATGWRPERQ